MLLEIQPRSESDLIFNRWARVLKCSPLRLERLLMSFGVSLFHRRSTQFISKLNLYYGLFFVDEIILVTVEFYAVQE